MYSVNQMENIFEIGRIIQEMWNYGIIDKKVESKELFNESLKWAEQFEVDLEKDYYADLYEYVVQRCKEKFGREC